MNQQIFIEKRPNDISASALADLIRRAHSVNIRKGLVYGTSEISDTKMEKTLLNSVCYVAYIGSEKRVVGTCTITDTELNRWYHHGKAAYIHLIAVDPEYAGMKIGSKMVEFVTKELRNQGGYQLAYLSTAEKNQAMRHVCDNLGYQLVVCNI